MSETQAINIVFKNVDYDTYIKIVSFFNESTYVYPEIYDVGVSIESFNTLSNFVIFLHVMTFLLMINVFLINIHQ